jgi:ABC-type sulfate transport system permease subunit
MRSWLLLAQQDNGGGAAGMVVGLIYLAIFAAVIVGFWKVFEKAGKPGWAAIIPIYNIIVLLEIIGKPIWWIILFFIPCVNFIVSILVALEVAKCFGKGAGFAIGLILLPFVFYPILGFGDARYVGPSAPAV